MVPSPHDARASIASAAPLRSTTWVAAKHDLGGTLCVRARRLPFVQYRDFTNPMKTVLLVSWTYAFAREARRRRAWGLSHGWLTITAQRQRGLISRDDVPCLRAWWCAWRSAADNWRRLVPARNAMHGILQAKLYEHGLRCTVQEVERKAIKQLPPGLAPR